jgi:triosephosphate isomerase
MRTPLLAGNWKMHGTVAEARALADSLRSRLADVENRDVLIAPPFPALPAVAESVAGSRFLLAAQNLHWEDCGAYTGEVSAPMLAAVGCTHVIVGHSERRQYFGDTDEWVCRKAKAALRHGLVPIVCVGETLEERDANRTIEVIERQVRCALEGLDTESVGRVIIAYEPRWAIGTGKVATPEQAQEAHIAIRRRIAQLGGQDVAQRTRILYGGSVKPDNVDALMRQPDLDGTLVGGASLDADDFSRIVRFRSP